MLPSRSWSRSSKTRARAASPSRPSTASSTERRISPRRLTSEPAKCSSPRSRPTTRRASSSTWSRIGALPPLDGPRPISRTTPSSSSPLMTSETVVRVRPVRRATSARLIGPRSYSVRTTSRSLWTRVCRWVALVGSAIGRVGPPSPAASALLRADFVQSLNNVRHPARLCQVGGQRSPVLRRCCGGLHKRRTTRRRTARLGLQPSLVAVTTTDSVRNPELRLVPAAPSSLVVPTTTRALQVRRVQSRRAPAGIVRNSVKSSSRTSPSSSSAASPRWPFPPPTPPRAASSSSRITV